MHTAIFAGIWSLEITGFMEEKFFSLQRVWLAGNYLQLIVLYLQPATDLLHWKDVAGLVIGCSTFETNGLTAIYPSL